MSKIYLEFTPLCCELFTAIYSHFARDFHCWNWNFAVLAIFLLIFYVNFESIRNLQRPIWPICAIKCSSDASSSTDGFLNNGFWIFKILFWQNQSFKKDALKTVNWFFLHAKYCAVIFLWKSRKISDINFLCQTVNTLYFIFDFSFSKFTIILC